MLMSCAKGRSKGLWWKESACGPRQEGGRERGGGRDRDREGAVSPTWRRCYFPYWRHEGKRCAPTLLPQVNCFLNAVQSSSNEFTSRTHSLTCNAQLDQLSKHRTEKHRLQQIQRQRDLSAQDTITPLFLYIVNSCLLLSLPSECRTYRYNLSNRPPEKCKRCTVSDSLSVLKPHTQYYYDCLARHHFTSL